MFIVWIGAKGLPSENTETFGALPCWNPDSPADPESSSPSLLAQMLLDKGAHADAKILTGRTPLFDTILAGHGEVVALLLNKGADVNATMPGNGKTPLYYAIFTGRPAIVKQLLDHGAFVNQVMNKGKNQGMTSLHHAAKSNTDPVRITQMLLDRGADIFARNKAGQTPEDIAEAGVENLSTDADSFALLLDEKKKVAALLRAEATRRAQCVAFATGHHGRLGAGSLVLSLHPEVVRMILEQV